MARCKECLHYDICAREGRMVQIDNHTWDDYNRLDDVERFCDNYIPTTDVVPKSEVEELEKEVERLTNILNSYALQYGTVVDKQKVIDKAKVEVAREIFEEIEHKLSFYFPATSFVNAPNTMHKSLVAMLAELKKKYAEDKG